MGLRESRSHQLIWLWRKDDKNWIQILMLLFCNTCLAFFIQKCNNEETTHIAELLPTQSSGELLPLCKTETLHSNANNSLPPATQYQGHWTVEQLLTRHSAGYPSFPITQVAPVTMNPSSILPVYFPSDLIGFSLLALQTYPSNINTKQIYICTKGEIITSKGLTPSSTQLFISWY